MPTRKLDQTGSTASAGDDEYRRFVEMARELKTDESPDAMDRALERVVGKPKPKDAPAPRPKSR
jgi:hypothetical protein